MTDQWIELKETIIELSTNDGIATQQEACKFLVDLMTVLEGQMETTSEQRMTRKRSLQIMRNYDLNDNRINKMLFPHGEIREAFDMAIDVLENENALIDSILEILDDVSSESSIGGVYWNSAQTIKVLRRRIMALKEGEQEWIEQKS